jgi:hypothetical protein
MEGKGGWCVGLTTLPLHVPIVLKSGRVKFLEELGPLQACLANCFTFNLQLKQLKNSKWISQESQSHLCISKDKTIHALFKQCGLRTYREWKYNTTYILNTDAHVVLAQHHVAAPITYAKSYLCPKVSRLCGPHTPSWCFAGKDFCPCRESNLR